METTAVSAIILKDRLQFYFIYVKTADGCRIVFIEPMREVNSIEIKIRFESAMRGLILTDKIM